jgi:hypothetical protein
MSPLNSVVNPIDSVAVELDSAANLLDVVVAVRCLLYANNEAG